MSLTIDYDEARDALYVFDGEPYPTKNVKVDSRLVLRVDPETEKVVGMMMHGVKSWPFPLDPTDTSTIAYLLEYHRRRT